MDNDNAATATDTEPRTWVGCLACYNAGSLLGKWVDGSEAGEVDSALLHNNPQTTHDELWVFDHEGYGGLISGECSPAEAQRLAEVLEEVNDPEAFAAYAEHVGAEYATPDGFEEAFQGEYRSEEDFAQELAEDLGVVPEDAGWPAYCIDWERAARDLFMGDYFSAQDSGGRVYVFRAL